MKLCFCLITLSLFCLASAKSNSHETQTLDLNNPENVEDFVFKGKKSRVKAGPKLQITNGKQASNTQFPFVAELAINSDTGGFLCTASLIAPNWLLTARHCAADIGNIQSILASFGAADRQAQRVQIYVVHVVWINAADGNHPDIALFRLAQNVPMSATVKTIRLPSMSKQNFGYEGQDFTAIGWGLISPGEFSRYLQYTSFRVLPSNQCYLNPYVMCSQPPTGTSQLLGGDSGGPGVIVEADGIETQIGVNVAYYTSGTTVWQATTKVTNFLSFIQAQTGVVYY